MYITDVAELSYGDMYFFACSFSGRVSQPGCKTATLLPISYFNEYDNCPAAMRGTSFMAATGARYRGLTKGQ